MAPDELDAYLAEQRVCRVATNGPDGPHATPLWYCWHGSAVWLYSLTRSKRWAELRQDPRIGIVVDSGHDYLELRGVEIVGTVEVIGGVPRGAEVIEELAPVEARFARKYLGVNEMSHDGKHAWLKIVPSQITSWDFRKITVI